MHAMHGARLDGVVAVVDDSVILRSELDTRMAPETSSTMTIADPVERQRQLDKLAARTLDRMIVEELVLHAAVAAKLEASDAEIDAAIEEIKKQNDLDFEWFAATLDAQGYTLKMYRRELRRSLSRMHAISQFVEPKVHVIDQEVIALYGELSRRASSPLPSFEHMKRDLREELRRRDLDVQTARWVEQLKRKANIIIEN